MENAGGNEEVCGSEQEGDGGVEEGRQNIIEHQGLGVQRKTNKEVDREVCGAVHDRGSSINECGEIAITIFNENLSGSQCEPDSVIQGAGKGTEEGGRKTSGSRRNRRMGGRKNLE